MTDTDREKRYVEKVRSVANDNGWQEWAPPPPPPGRLRRLWLRWKWRKNWPAQDHEAPRA